MNIDYSNQSGYGEFENTGYVLEQVGNEHKSTGQQVDVAKVFLSLVICIIGLVGNLGEIILIFGLKRYKNSVKQWYVLQLAFADFLFLLTLPFQISEDLNNGFIYPEWMCKAKETILFVNYYASILFLMIMSIGRYIELSYTFSDGLQKLRKHISALIIIPFAWIISLLLCIPVMLYSYKIGVSPHCTCSYEFPHETNHTALCIEEGHRTKEELEQCLKLSRNNNPLSETGEKHCKPAIVQNSSVNSINNFLSTGIYTDQLGVLTGVDYSGYYTDYSNYFDNAHSGYVNTPDDLAIHASCHYGKRPFIWTFFVAFNFAIFLLLLIVTIICYGLIVRRLSATHMGSTNNPSTSRSTQSNTRKERNTKRKNSPSMSDRDRRLITIMCAALVACFVVCWLHFLVNLLGKVVGIKTATHQICEILPIVALILAYLNSALRPYLYIFLGSNIIGICKRKNKSGNLESETKQPADDTIPLKETQLFNAKETVPNDDTIQGFSPE